MEIEILTHNDVPSLIAIQPEDWPDIIPGFYFYVKESFCFPIKVIINGQIVGIGAAIIHNDVAWFGHIIVHSAHRGRGIGKVITRTLIDISRENKCGTIYLIATDLGTPVYEKLGFITETDYLFFKDIDIEKQLSPSIHIEKYRDEFRDQIAAIDKLNSGEDRLFHLDSHLNNGYQYTRNKIVQGFYLPTLGEGLIIANNESAGLDLLHLHLNFKDKVAFPKDNLSVTQHLHSKGFKAIREARRMRLGKERKVNFTNIYNRIGGNIG